MYRKSINDVKDAYIDYMTAGTFVDQRDLEGILDEMGDEMAWFKASAVAEDVTLEQVLNLYNWSVWQEHCDVCDDKAVFYSLIPSEIKFETLPPSAETYEFTFQGRYGEMKICPDCSDSTYVNKLVSLTHG